MGNLKEKIGQNGGAKGVTKWGRKGPTEVGELVCRKRVREDLSAKRKMPKRTSHRKKKGRVRITIGRNLLGRRRKTSGRAKEEKVTEKGVRSRRPKAKGRITRRGGECSVRRESGGKRKKESGKRKPRHN